MSKPELEPGKSRAEPELEPGTSHYRSQLKFHRSKNVFKVAKQSKIEVLVILERIRNSPNHTKFQLINMLFMNFQNFVLNARLTVACKWL